MRPIHANFSATTRIPTSEPHAPHSLSVDVDVKTNGAPVRKDWVWRAVRLIETGQLGSCRVGDLTFGIYVYGAIRNDAAYPKSRGAF